MPNLPTRGAKMLARYLTTTKTRQAALARHLHVSAPTVHDWLRGNKRPNADYRRGIEAATAGAVPAAAWDTASDLRRREAIVRVAPLATGTEG